MHRDKETENLHLGDLLKLENNSHFHRTLLHFIKASICTLSAITTIHSTNSCWGHTTYCGPHGPGTFVGTCRYKKEKKKTIQVPALILQIWVATIHYYYEFHRHTHTPPHPPHNHVTTLHNFIVKVDITSWWSPWIAWSIHEN